MRMQKSKVSGKLTGT